MGLIVIKFDVCISLTQYEKPEGCAFICVIMHAFVCSDYIHEA